MPITKEIRNVPAEHISPAPTSAISPDRKLGEGGFGIVYRCNWAGEDVAVKVLKCALSQGMLEIFRDEARVWFNLCHENVLPLYGINDMVQPPFMVSPYQENGNAAAYFNKHASLCPVEEKLEFIRGVAGGLAYMHRDRIVHGDLKGLNVLIGKYKQPLLSDFGLARTVSTVSSTMSSQSHGQGAGGTYGWMGPELLNGDVMKPHEPGDIFALGMVILEVFTGQIPFPNAMNANVVARWIENGKRPKPENYDEATRSRIPSEVWNLMEKCWRQNYAERPSATEVVVEIQLLIRKFKTSPPPRLVSSPAPTPPQNRPQKQEAEIIADMKRSNLGDLCELMKNSLDKPNVIIEGLKLIITATYTSDENRIKIASSGGIPVILDAMKKHCDHAGVQEHACWALKYFATNDDNKVKIASSGGIPAILNAMKKHSNHAGVQEQACRALASLAANDDNKIKIASSGGISVILDSMKKRADHAGVQEAACWALSNLSFNNNNKNLIKSSNALDLIKSAMKKFPNSPIIQQRGKLTLQNCA